MVRWACWNSKSSFIWTGISLNQGEKRYVRIHSHVLIFLLQKNDKQYQPVSHSVRLFSFFSMHNIWDSGNSGRQRYSSLRTSRDRVFVIWSSLRRTLPRIDTYCILKKYNNFKCALQQRWKLFAKSTPRFWKVTVAKWEYGIKHCLTLKINQFIFTKHFEKTSLCLDKIYTFSYMFQNSFQIFWKGFTLQCTAIKIIWGSNNVQFPFLFTRVVKPDFIEHRGGAVCA